MYIRKYTQADRFCQLSETFKWARSAEADIAIQHAIGLAEALRPGHARAKAYATQSYLRMLNRDYHKAIAWGEKAIELSKELEDARIMAGTYLTVGAAWMFVDYERGCDYVRTSLKIAQGLEDGGVGVADAYMMLGTASGEVYAYENAARYLSDGIAFARTHDLDRVAHYMIGWQALSVTCIRAAGTSRVRVQMRSLRAKRARPPIA